MAGMQASVPSVASVERRRPGYGAGGNRVVSVDVLRGLTIALMILVNDPGDWKHTFTQLDHAEWNGWTLTDTVFPTFLFLVGAAAVFSIGSRLTKGASRGLLARQILWRATKIFLLKCFLSLYPHFRYTHMRIYGVLTRIAVCYLLVGWLLLLTRRPRWLLAMAAVLLVGYYVLLRWVPVPGAGVPGRDVPFDVPFLDMYWNLVAYVDRGGGGLDAALAAYGHAV